MIKKINVRQAIAASFFLTLTLALAFVVIEPTLSRAVEDQFTVTQSITSEIAFLTGANNVTMNGSIAGVTGGTSYGTTTAIVTTNNAAGYTMTIKASSSPAMQADSQGGSISDYSPAVTGVPDYAYSAAGAGTHKFGFSVSASTTAELATKFKDNGSNTCNTGSADTGGSGSCWMGLSTSATSTIVSSSETTASGSTSSVYFRVSVGSNSGLAQDTYTATATLTAVTN